MTQQNQIIINSATPIGSGRFYYKLDTNQGEYYYTPAEFAAKGLLQGNNQFFEQGFLRDKNLLKEAKPIQIESGILSGAAQNLYENPNQGLLFTKEQAAKFLGASNKEFNDWENVVSSGGWVDLYDINEINKNTGSPYGPIIGLSQYENNLVYARPTEPGQNSSYIIPYDEYDSGFSLRNTKITQKGGFLGDLLRAVGSIPFLPEIAGLATGNPQVYATLKGIQAGVSGEDPLKAGLKAGATIFAAGTIGGPSAGGGGGAGELASVGETGYGLTGPISSTPPSVPSAFDQAVTGALSGTSPIAPSVQVGTQGFGSATLPSGASVVGASGSLLSGAPIETRNLADYPLAVETAYPAVPIEQTYSPAPGSFQEALPGLGVETQASQAPFTAAPGSFAAATAPAATAAGYGLLSQPSSTISVQQALRGAQLANQLMNPPEFPGMQMDAGQQPRMGGVDYSGLLNLLQNRAGIPNVSGLLGPAQIRYPSLLG